MAHAYFVVRAVVEEPLRQKFDQWYGGHHLPLAIEIFNAEKGWRFWVVPDPGAADPGVHYAVYRFADMARLDAALKGPRIPELTADFDHAWPSGVARTGERLDLVGERSA